MDFTPLSRLTLRVSA